MLNLTIKDLGCKYLKKELSVTEVIKHCNSLVSSSKLNLFISSYEEDSIIKAGLCDQMIARGEHTPLLGIPMAHKDLLCVKGSLTTCASKMLSNYISPYDAHVVTELNKAGSIMVAKCNMDEFAMGSSNETSYFGPAYNPWGSSRSPGGSSGGSAASVAARIVMLATGSDTGGSIRQPASFNGVVGMKPSYGLVSRYGLIAFASSLDTVGPIAKTVEDCAIVLDYISSYDLRDSTSVVNRNRYYSSSIDNEYRSKPLEGYKIGIADEFFNDALQAEIKVAIMDAIKLLESMGATTIKISLKNLGLCAPIYYILAPAEASSNLSRYTGVNFGYRSDNPSNLEDLYFNTRTEGFGAEVKRRIAIGSYVLSSTNYDSYYIKANNARSLVSQDIKDAFEICDLIIAPTTPTTAFKIPSKMSPIEMYLSDMYTHIANLAGIPALSLQCGFDNQGLPIGMQLMANVFKETTALYAGHEYQKRTDWHKAMPKQC